MIFGKPKKPTKTLAELIHPVPDERNAETRIKLYKTAREFILRFVHNLGLNHRHEYEGMEGKGNPYFIFEGTEQFISIKGRYDRYEARLSTSYLITHPNSKTNYGVMIDYSSNDHRSESYVPTFRLIEIADRPDPETEQYAEIATLFQSNDLDEIDRVLTYFNEPWTTKERLRSAFSEDKTKLTKVPLAA